MSRRSRRWEPNKKPVGPVELDWDVLNSLGIAGNLKTYLYPQGASYIELVNNQVPSDRGAGWSAATDSTGRFPVAGSQSIKYPAASNKLQGATTFTAIGSAKFNSLGFVVSVFRHDGSITAIQKNSNTRLRSIIWTPSILVIDTGFTPTVGVFHTQTITRDSNNVVKVFIDSDEKTSQTRSGALDSSSNVFAIGGTESNGEDLDGQSGTYIAFDAHLSDATRELIEKNPYILLRRISSPPYPPPSAVSTALAVNDITTATTITQPALTQHNALAVDDAFTATLITEPALIQHNVLAVDSLNVDTLITSPALIQHNVLAVDDLDVATTLTEAGLTQHNILAVNAILVSTEVTNVSLTGAAVLAVDNIDSGTVITQVTLDTAIALLVDNLAIGTDITSPQLTQHHVLVVDDMSVSTLLSVVSFGGAILGCLDGEVVIASLLNGVVTIQPLLGGEATIIPVLDGNVTIN